MKAFPLSSLVLSSLLLFSTLHAGPFFNAITTKDYCDFLNSEAKSDINSFYNEKMGSDPLVASIIRRGEPGHYSYVAIADREEQPVAFVNGVSVVFFCDWLQGSCAVPGDLLDIDPYLAFNGVTLFMNESGSSQLTLAVTDDHQKNQGSLTQGKLAIAVAGSLFVAFMLKGDYGPTKIGSGRTVQSTTSNIQSIAIEDYKSQSTLLHDEKEDDSSSLVVPFATNFEDNDSPRKLSRGSFGGEGKADIQEKGSPSIRPLEKKSYRYDDHVEEAKKHSWLAIRQDRLAIREDEARARLQEIDENLAITEDKRTAILKEIVANIFLHKLSTSEMENLQTLRAELLAIRHAALEERAQYSYSRKIVNSLKKIIPDWTRPAVRIFFEESEAEKKLRQQNEIKQQIRIAASGARPSILARIQLAEQKATEAKAALFQEIPEWQDASKLDDDSKQRLIDNMGRVQQAYNDWMSEALVGQLHAEADAMIQDAMKGEQLYPMPEKKRSEYDDDERAYPNIDEIPSIELANRSANYDSQHNDIERVTQPAPHVAQAEKLFADLLKQAHEFHNAFEVSSSSAVLDRQAADDFYKDERREMEQAFDKAHRNADDFRVMRKSWMSWLQSPAAAARISPNADHSSASEKLWENLLMSWLQPPAAAARTSLF